MYYTYLSENIKIILSIICTFNFIIVYFYSIDLNPAHGESRKLQAICRQQLYPIVQTRDCHSLQIALAFKDLRRSGCNDLPITLMDPSIAHTPLASYSQYDPCGEHGVAFLMNS